MIDLATGPHGTIYAVAMSKDSSGAYHQRLHAIDLTTGAELFNGPVDVQATYPGTADNSTQGGVVFDPKQYKSRPGLLLVNGVVYTSWGSHCDIRPYTGWTIGYDETTLAQTIVFNFAPNGEGAAVWGAGSGIAADSNGILFFQIANGTFDATLNGSGFPGEADYGNAFVKLSVSGGVLLIPDVTDSNGITATSESESARTGTSICSTAKTWANSTRPITVICIRRSRPVCPWRIRNDVIRGFKMTAAVLTFTPSSTSKTSFAFPGTTPSISANGASNGILWAVENSNPAVLHAYDATNLATELYNSNQAPSGRDQFGNGNKFITPMIANGKVYVGTPNSVAVFGSISSSNPTLTSVSPSNGTQGAAVNVTLAGANFSSGATVGVSGTGLTVSNLKVVSSSQITASFTLTSSAATGPRNVTVTTTAGTSNAATFTVNAKGHGVSLTSITPSSGTRNNQVHVTLAGSNFASGAAIQVSGTGVSVSTVRVVSSSQITATFSINSSAATGARTVTVTTTAGTSKGVTFTVNP